MRVPSRAIALLAATAVSAIAAAAAFGHSNAISTVAGTGVDGSVGDGGPAAEAQFRSPEDVAPLLDGGYLVADYEARVVRKVDRRGVITRVAGDGSGGLYGDGGPALSAAVTPASVSPTKDGGFLIAECIHHRIRRVHPDGTIETIAGKGTAGFAGDGGQATAATLNDPQDALELADGSILIADTGNGRIRRVGTNGVITTVAGRDGIGANSMLAVNAVLDEPSDLTALPDGGYAFVDQGSAELHRVGRDGQIERIAGSSLNIGIGDGGLATGASFTRPTGAAALAGGGYLVADLGAHRVRRIAPDGTISTAAGTGSSGAAGDGGDAAAAELSGPYDIGVAPRGGYYVADSGNHAIRHVDSDDLPAVGPGGVDVVPPPAPEITSSPARAGADAAPWWSFRLPEAGTTAWCRLSSGASKVFDWAPCASPASYDLSRQPDGEYTFEVKAKDAAGNASSYASSKYVLDRPDPVEPAVPAPPVVTTDEVPELGRNQLPPGSPEPELGRSVSVVPAAGIVRVKVPGERGYVTLADARALPVGTIFDARHGEIALSTALDREGNTQTGLFRGGKFAVRQSRKGRGRTHLDLRGGDFSSCARPRDGIAAIAAKKKKKGKVRALWGEDKNGKYSTHGRNSAATVRGTEWLTEDRCEGTRTRVRSGVVKVYDRVKRRSVLVRAGHSYLARVRR